MLAALAPSFLGLLICGLQGPLLRPPYEGGGKSLEARLATVTCTQSPSPLSRPRFTKLQKPLIQAPSTVRQLPLIHLTWTRACSMGGYGMGCLCVCRCRERWKPNWYSHPGLLLHQLLRSLAARISLFSSAEPWMQTLMIPMGAGRMPLERTGEGGRTRSPGPGLGRTERRQHGSSQAG